MRLMYLKVLFWSLRPSAILHKLASHYRQHYVGEYTGLTNFLDYLYAKCRL